MRSQRTSRRSGVVLLMVLVLLAVAGTVLAAMARQCGRDALESGRRQRALQRKWGVISCRTYFLAAAEAELRRAGGEEGPPPATVRLTVRLGETDFDLLLSDEQSKANVNLLTARLGEEVAAPRLEALQSDVRDALPVRLRPGKPPVGQISRVAMRYAAYDQVFAFDHPSQLAPDEASEPSPAGRITCWGSGRVNFRRADRQVLSLILAGVLRADQIERIIQFRDDVPDGTLAEACDAAELPRKVLPDVEWLLTEESTCYSLWVIVRGQTRSWYRFFVGQGGDAENDSPGWRFEW